jgi:hypothetical protein
MHCKVVVINRLPDYWAVIKYKLIQTDYTDGIEFFDLTKFSMAYDLNSCVN